MTFKGAATWLIEDDQLARESTARLLRAWDCSVFEFQSAEAALRAIDDAVNPPAASILIVDQRLPGLTGLQTVERIRARLHQPVPAVLISGDLAPELAASAQAHSIPVLTKPVQPARLRTLIHRLLAGF
jgi:CheY-like chemotaxis protein